MDVLYDMANTEMPPVNFTDTSNTLIKAGVSAAGAQ